MALRVSIPSLCEEFLSIPDGNRMQCCWCKLALLRLTTHVQCFLTSTIANLAYVILETLETGEQLSRYEGIVFSSPFFE